MFRSLAVLTMIVAMGAAGYSAYWLARPCQLLDRMLGITGCESNLIVSQFALIDVAAMSPLSADGAATMFGYIRKAEDWTPGIVRLDFNSLTELFQSTLDLGDGFGHLTFSDDGTRAVVACMGPSPCTDDGKRSAIVSVRDGAILATGGNDDEFVRFPGDPVPAHGSGVGLFAAAGERIVDLRRDGAIVLLDGMGQDIAVLHQGHRSDVLRSGVSVSPSGSYIAMLKRSDGEDARLAIWDARSGAKIRDLALGTDYIHRFTPVWIDGDAKVALLRQSGEDTSIDIFSAL